MRIFPLPLLLLALPLLEIAGFVIVGRQIGALATVGLVLASSVAGSLLLRRQGFGVMRRVQAELDAGHDPSRQLAHGAMIVLAALLLIIPGFITDIAALLLLLAPVRDFAWRAIGRRIAVFSHVRGFGKGDFGERRRGTTIELDEDDFSRTGSKPDPNSPWRRLDDE
ncbi:FxsA family protein [Aquamicrobium soli]|uniref:FxsA family protein n=1 Tax=Aquamicrobium soli TaxID=1811518 RepID=A0ABV7K8N4_9HYPH